MVVYLDLVLLLNFGINLLLLRGTGRLGAARLHRGRLALGAGLGAGYAALSYLWPPLALWPGKLLCGGAMLCCSFGLRRSTLRLAGVFAALSLVLCGAVYGVETLLEHQPVGSGLFYPVSAGTLLLTAGAVSAACRLLLPRLTHAADSIVPVTLSLDGRSVHLSALRDSGNALRDPVGGGPVLVAAWEQGAALLGLPLRAGDFDAPDRLALRLRRYHPRLIPYRAVGLSCGLLLAIPCRIQIARHSHTGLVAFCPTPLSDGGAYDALIGAETLPCGTF